MSIKLDLGAVTAYAIAVKNGFKGTEADWLASLKGAKGDTGGTGPQGPKGDKGDGQPGADGKSAYQYAQESGYTGTREEFGQLLANAGLNLKAAETAKEGAEAAKQAAETAQQAAAENQKNAGTQAANAKASADTAAEQAAVAEESAADAANSATAAQESETNAGLSATAAANAEAAAKQAQQAAETAKADAETAKTVAGNSADAAANSAADAKKTLESIPSDYSTMSGKVDKNTSVISELKKDLGDTILRNICNATPLKMQDDYGISNINNEFLSSTPTNNNQYTFFSLPDYILKENHTYLIAITSSPVKGSNVTIVSQTNANVIDWNVLQNKVNENNETHTERIYKASENANIAIYWFVNTGETVNVKIGIYDITDCANHAEINFSEIRPIYSKIKASNADKADYADKAGSIARKEENIACIGDSLTYGYGATVGSTDYPSVLQTLVTNKTVYNLGVSGEATNEILARQGGFPAIINPVNIPAETNTIEITFSSNINIGDDNTVLLRKASNNLVNPVVIDGVEGNISASNNKYFLLALKMEQLTKSNAHNMLSQKKCVSIKMIFKLFLWEQTVDG